MTALRVKHHPKRTSRIFGLSLSMTETLGKRIICSSTSLIRTGIYTPYSAAHNCLVTPHLVTSNSASTYSATVSRCIIYRIYIQPQPSPRLDRCRQGFKPCMSFHTRRGTTISGIRDFPFQALCMD